MHLESKLQQDLEAICTLDMDAICSRWRKPKGRQNKRRRAAAENFKKRQSYMEVENAPELPTNSGQKTENGYIVMCKSVWSSLLKNIPCPDCKNTGLNVSESCNSMGLSSKIGLNCSSCEKDFGSVYTSEREKESGTFNINNKIVECFLAIGRGHAALETFSMILGTPSMDKKTFNRCMHNICSQNKTLKFEMLTLSHQTIRNAHILADPALESKEVLDISVTYDGTWQKRGHTSNLGVFCVMDIRSNLVVDFEVLSKYCQECVISARDLGSNSAEHKIWFDNHKEDCEQNYQGSSGGMEVHAAVVMWTRSIEKCKFRYTTMLSDGDSKAFQHLKSIEVYGPSIAVSKEECINHVSKRLNTALRNTVKEWKVKKVTLGGKKAGSLKETTISKLQNYYRKAIKDNAPDVAKMKSSIFATLFHCMSTDAKPQHNKCPQAKDSWCFFQRALAQGKKPKSHKSMKTTLSPEVVEKILPVYQRLASDEILSRCVAAKTQNSNESLHSCIWRKCPKDIFVSKRRLELGVVAAVREHNLGYVTALSMGEDSASAVQIAQRKQHSRTTQHKRKSSEVYKKERNVKKYKKKTAINKENKSEGITYDAGGF